MNDCNGIMHNCFNTLDSGKVIVMEFFMTCNMCITAGNEIETMRDQLENHYPGMIQFYQLGYTNSYSCTSVLNWVNSNGFKSVPFDSGAALVAYYGGFGMPTIAVIGGVNHEVLFTDIGYTNGDTAAIAASIHDFFNTTGLSSPVSGDKRLTIFPNPSTDRFNVQWSMEKSGLVRIELLTLRGETIAMLLDEKMEGGLSEKSFGTHSFAPGVYLLKVIVDGSATFRKLTIAH
jgi:hypothetical protein